ncbi:MAG: hypothetical protein IJ816_03095 [Alloprevotella sp.]|nr:hypothetical protein [Alloprevotella sp.]
MARSKRKTLRERITTNYFTLYATLVVTSVLWLLPDFRNPFLIGGFSVAVALAFILRESNNHFQWIRVRSRMTSSTWLMLATVCIPCHAVSLAWVLPFCLLGAYDLLFAASAHSNRTGFVFHTFLLLTLASYLLPEMVYMMPVFLWQMGYRLRILSWRTFFAALLGIVFPLWLYFAWNVWNGTLGNMFDFMHSCIEWEIPNYAEVGDATRVYMIFIGVCAFFGITHCLRARFRDKKIVRDMHYIMMVHEVLLLALFFFKPSLFSFMLPLVLMNTAPLLSHYFTLARGRWLMGIWFDLWLAGFVVLWLAGFFHWWGL